MDTAKQITYIMLEVGFAFGLLMLWSALYFVRPWRIAYFRLVDSLLLDRPCVWTVVKVTSLRFRKENEVHPWKMSGASIPALRTMQVLYRIAWFLLKCDIIRSLSQLVVLKRLGGCSPVVLNHDVDCQSISVWNSEWNFDKGSWHLDRFTYENMINLIISILYHKCLYLLYRFS